MSDLHWYRPASHRGLALDEIAAMLRPYGISQKGPIGQVLYWRDESTGLLMKEIGDVIVRQDGRIEVWPYGGVTQRDLRVLYGSAEEAFRNQPRTATGWHYKRLAGAGRSFWRTRVIIPLAEGPVPIVAHAEFSIEELNEIACDLAQAS